MDTEHQTFYNDNINLLQGDSELWHDNSPPPIDVNTAKVTPNSSLPKFNTPSLASNEPLNMIPSPPPLARTEHTSAALDTSELFHSMIC